MLCVLILAVAVIFLTTPDVDKLKGCLVTQMYKVNLCDSNPGFVQLSQVSPYIIGAVIMSEDASFYFHEGVDVTEIKESFMKNLMAGKFVRGGSTITQQLAKNVFLSGEKSVIRKLQEIYLAFEMERLFTKKRILTLYLNVVEFGPNIFGINKATWHYFNKPPSDVSPEEAAFLAFLLPNPKKYSQSFSKHQMTPFADKSVRKILHKMLAGHKISESEYVIARGRVASMFGGTSAELESAARLGPGEDADEEEKDFKFESEIDSDTAQ